MEQSNGQRQELAAELRRIRLLAGLSHDEVARKTGLSESNVSRLEAGQALPSLDEVDHWSYAVGASQRVREQLRVLAAAAATEVLAFRPWLHAGPVATQEDVGRLEASAVAIRSCEPLVVPGLLQTADYARQVIGAFSRPRAELEAVTAARIARQKIMRDPSRNFEFIVTDYGLRWSPIGTPRAIMSAQLEHISEVAELPNVSVGVIRAGMQTKVPVAEFTLYEGVQAEGAGSRVDIVMIETPAPLIVITDPTDVRNYHYHLAWLREAADFGPAAVSRIGSRKH